MNNYLTVLNYIIQRLADISDISDIFALIAELRMSTKALSCVKYYEADDFISAMFGTVEMNEKEADIDA